MLDKIFSFFSSKPADNILDKKDGLLVRAGQWIGNMNFTDEEQAEHKAKVANSINEFVSKSLSENTERSKTRRMIAIAWIKVELFLILLSAAIAPFDMKLAQFYWSMVTSNVMWSITAGIAAFFFGGHLYSSHIKKGN